MPKVGTLSIAEPTDIKAIQAQVDEKLLEIASRELGVPRDQLVVRDALPDEDFGFSTPQYTITPSAAGWNDFVNTTVDDNRFIAIYGIAAVDADNVTYVKFTSGAKTLDYWEVESLQAQQNKFKIATSPIILRQNTAIRIQIYATSTDSVIMPLLARVVEVKGRIVEPGSTQ